MDLSETSNSADASNNSGEAASSEDADLKMLNARRMVELRKRMSLSKQQEEAERKIAEKPPPPSDREILRKALVERGDEVLAAAESSYPNEMRILIPRLATLIRQGKVTTIRGGELLQFFRSLGMRVSVSTSISVEEHGKFVSIAEKLKRESEE